MASIEDLLKLLQQSHANEKSLPNTKDTWRRIGEEDSFSELGLKRSELEEFLKDWMDQNPYKSIS